MGVPYHSPAVPRDLSFFLCGDNLDLVCSEAEKFETVCNRGTNIIAIFSDPTGEHEKVYTAEQSNVCTDCLAYGNDEHIQRKSRPVDLWRGREPQAISHRFRRRRERRGHSDD